MYITDHAQQVQLIKEMTHLRRDLDMYEVYYHHPQTNQMWKSFFPLGRNGELGPKLLRQEPLPENLEELLLICLSEDAPENAVGLAIEMTAKIHEWPEVFRILKENYSDYNRKQVRFFLKNFNVKKYPEIIESLYEGQEVNLSEKELKKLVWRSRRLKFKSLFI
jgi:hypothetical protein